MSSLLFKLSLLFTYRLMETSEEDAVKVDEDDEAEDRARLFPLEDKE